jgi:hypothetical protein
LNSFVVVKYDERIMKTKMKICDPFAQSLTAADRGFSIANVWNSRLTSARNLTALFEGASFPLLWIAVYQTLPSD